MMNRMLIHMLLLGTHTLFRTECDLCYAQCTIPGANDHVPEGTLCAECVVFALSISCEEECNQY